MNMMLEQRARSHGARRGGKLHVWACVSTSIGLMWGVLYAVDFRPGRVNRRPGGMPAQEVK